MLILNNEIYEPEYIYKLGSKWIEFAYCGENKTPVARIFHKTKSLFKCNSFLGQRALNELNKFIKKVEYKTQSNIKYGTWSKQNVYYGDFKKTHKKDCKGNPIYLQTKKNFNNQTEILEEIQTFYSSLYPSFS